MLLCSLRSAAVATGCGAALVLGLAAAPSAVSAPAAAGAASVPPAAPRATVSCPAAGATGSADATDPNGPRYTAEQIHRFLVRFYGHHGPTPRAREHLVADDLKERAAQDPDSDLLLCAPKARRPPRDVRVGEVTTAQSAGVGWAPVTTYWAGGVVNTFTAYVDLDATEPLKLLDVVCEPPDA
jgi:hypothetical protein